jgi:CubicO group peptidase (beta-lactamase class C family)
MKETSFSISEIRTYIERAYQQWNVPGGLAAIIRDGKPVLAEGFGVCEAGKAPVMDPETAFAIGSCTKAFTSAAIGLLVDEGKLDWDDPVVKFLPDFTMYDPWVTRHVTIRDLLNHKLGIQRWNRLFFRQKEFDPDDFISRIRYMQPVKEFRTRYHYGNEQFIVAGKIVEVASGMPYADFLQKRIFEPLEMNSTYPNLKQMLSNHKGPFARGHYNQADSLMPVQMRFFQEQTPAGFWEIGTNAAGSIWSTIGDIQKWIELFLGQGVYKGKQFLSRAVFEEITTPQFMIYPKDSEIVDLMPLGMDIQFQAYAFGWMIFSYMGRKLIVHGGNTVNGNTVIGFIPEEELGIVTFINTYGGVIHILLAFYLFEAMLGKPHDYSGDGLELAKTWLEEMQPVIQSFEDKRKIDSRPSLPLESYAGIYTSPLLGELYIDYRDGQLRQRYGSDMAASLIHWEDDVFRLKFDKPYWGVEFAAFEIGEGKTVNAIRLQDMEGREIQRMEKR